MKKRSTIYVLFILGIFWAIFSSNSSGSIPARTGAPGETTCASASCHLGTPNSGNATIDLLLDDSLANYTPGTTHKVQISIANPQTASKNGFQVIALDSLANSVGTFELIDENQTKLIENADKTYITHSAGGNGATSWEMNWTAPAEDAGEITFYFAVNDANGNNSRMGDQVYTGSKGFVSATATSTKYLDPGLVTIFPNPVRQNLQIKTGSLTFDQYTLFNLNGQPLLQGAINAEINVGELNNGTYLLRLTNASGVLMKKLVIQH